MYVCTMNLIELSVLHIGSDGWGQALEAVEQYAEIFSKLRNEKLYQVDLSVRERNRLRQIRYCIQRRIEALQELNVPSDAIRHADMKIVADSESCNATHHLSVVKSFPASHHSHHILIMRFIYVVLFIY